MILLINGLFESLIGLYDIGVNECSPLSYPLGFFFL